MLIIIPCIYILSFLIAFRDLLRQKPQSILVFFALGLPIYITSLSILHQIGLGKFIPLFQGFKEIIAICTLGFLLYTRGFLQKVTLADQLILAYLAYTAIYVFLPLGDYGFVQKLLALKSLSFFPIIYFIGRFMDPDAVNLKKYFNYVLIISILAGIVLMGEFIVNEHLQTHTGYAQFMQTYFDMEPSGNFNLSWTFETSNGLKRYASFYGTPLELGVNTLFALVLVLVLFTNDQYQFQPSKLGMVALIISILAILLAISRASLASYFLVLYVYALMTHQKKWLKLFYLSLGILSVLMLFYAKGDIYELIINTINFTDNSSAYHVIQWLEGIDAIQARPMGMGLGMSGRVSGGVGDNIGGENQFIIIGVQAGIIAVLVYMMIYVVLIKQSITLYKNNKGKIRMLALCILLVKIGMLIPTFTANIESYLYIPYFTWFLAGMMNTISNQIPIAPRLNKADA